MPFINTKTNIAISEEQERILKTELGKAVSVIGKSEPWLMVNFEDQQRLYFKGDNRLPTVFIEVKIYGKSSPENYSALSAKITQIYSDVLKVPSDRIYIAYFETENWGWNGSNF